MSGRDLKPPLGSRPLSRVIPELDRLLADPATFLEHQAVRIGPLRKYRPLMFLVGCFLFGGVYFLLGERNPIILVFMFAVAPVLMLALTWPAHASLVLISKGVILEDGKLTICCPWSLFRSEGQVFIRQAGFVQEIILPVQETTIGRVFSCRDGKVIAEGQETHTDSFRFLSAQELQIDADYEAYPRELGELLLRLGRMLGSAEAATVTQQLLTELGAARFESQPAEKLSPANLQEEGAVTPFFNPDGWLTISLVRLTFPPHCCGCGQETVDHQRIAISEGFRWANLLAVWFHLDEEREVAVTVPLCKLCQRRARWWRTLRVSLKGAFGCATVGVLYLIAFQHLEVCPGSVLVLVSVALALAIRTSSTFPFESRYQANARTVAFNFWQDGYATRLFNHVRALK
jgi:hypothetical protein